MKDRIRFSSLVALVVASLAPAPRAGADSLTQVWAIEPDVERIYVTTANLERGIAYNAVSGNVLLLSRAGGPKIVVLRGSDGSDGSELTGEPRVLNLTDEIGETPVSGGTFSLNLVGAADDGAVYACNLATSIGTVRLYRWADDAAETPVAVAYSGDPLEGIANPGSGQDIRFGDTFAVRGSGKDTQLLQTARNGKYVIVYTTTDGLNFTPKVFTDTGAMFGKVGLGLAFGAGNTFWAKLNGNMLQRVQFDLAASKLTLLNEVATSIVGASVTGIGADPTGKHLAAVNYVDHTLTVYDVSDPTAPVQVGDPMPFPASNANVNGTGAAALSGDNVFAVDSNNGVLGVRIEKSVVVDPPVISTPPAGVTVYEGASHTFSVAAQGTPPFTYQWFFKDAPIAGATGAQLTLSNISSTEAGAYTVTVANSAGSVPGGPATLTVKAPLNAGILKPLWALNPGDRPYLTTDNTQRGVAYNPATGNLLVASRSPANAIVVLDSATGAEKHQLRTTTADDLPLFVGGTLLLNMIGVAEDGVVYAANLVTDGSASGLHLYRWDDDRPDTVPTPLFDVAELAIPERWGDTMDVRGRGASTQILLGTRGLAPQEGQKFALLTTADGFNFNAQIFTVADVPASVFGLGIAFGGGNTVFGTANGQPLVHVAFDPAAGTATLAHSYGASQVPFAASFLGVQASSNLLAAVALETPDNVLLYDLADAASPELLDQRLILPEQPNVNGTGSVDFGGSRVFVLDTNQGLRAFEIDRAGSPAGPATLAQPRITGGNFTFTLTGSDGRDYTVQKTPDFKAWTDVGTYKSPATVTEPVGAGPAFYRAVAR